MLYTYNIGGDPVSGSVGMFPEAISVSVPAGSYKVLSNAINVRLAPSKSSAIVGQEKKGQIIDFDGWSKVADGFVWGRYTTPNGTIRYAAVRTTNGFQYAQQIK